MNLDGQHVVDAIAQWLEDEHRDKKQAPSDKVWTKVATVPGTPQQANGYDCGVFMCTFAHYIRCV
jgi:sentrin-specific protease 1